MADDVRVNADLDSTLDEAEARYRAANPRSLARHQAAGAAMPGGNTRTVLHYPPFPLAWAKGEGATLTDLDGHRYTDFLGEYTAGLYGHSNPVIQDAVRAALADGIVLGGPNRYEAELAGEISRRFPSLELLRFCNSGTEANLFALSTARAVTGRAKILAFTGGYHGGVFYYGLAGSAINAPFPTILARYNDAEGAAAAIAEHAADLAAVVVEPMQGSGGCIPGDPGFLAALRAACDRHGVVLIFDEVMTSRLSPGGRQALLGITPDMTTLGKYLGGGLSFGAFGGRRRFMERYDPARPDAIAHAGTFNNNVLSMAAGLAGITRVLTPEALSTLNARGEALRERLNALAGKRGLPVQATGCGSLVNLHFHRGAIRAVEDYQSDAEANARRAKLTRLFHLDMIAAGQYLALRGFMALSLPITDADCDRLAAAVDEFLATRGRLIETNAR
ncbi:MAG: glutamate-1-semialdehyde 2,1-aminomutase [Alphaproteobacteria bacterium]|nr:MAG: glutamate-1-semialdehyde 2,1-aminomutase [Alphaproteobacteria bacterium]